MIFGNGPDQEERALRMIGWPDAPAVQAAEPTRTKHIAVPKQLIADALKQVAERALGGPLPPDTRVTRHWTNADNYHIELDSQEFPQNADGVVSQALPTRKR